MFIQRIIKIKDFCKNEFTLELNTLLSEWFEAISNEFNGKKITLADELHFDELIQKDWSVRDLFRITICSKSINSEYIIKLNIITESETETDKILFLFNKYIPAYNLEELLAITENYVTNNIEYASDKLIIGWINDFVLEDAIINHIQKVLDSDNSQLKADTIYTLNDNQIYFEYFLEKIEDTLEKEQDESIKYYISSALEEFKEEFRNKSKENEMVVLTYDMSGEARYYDLHAVREMLIQEGIEMVYIENFNSRVYTEKNSTPVILSIDRNRSFLFAQANHKLEFSPSQEELLLELINQLYVSVPCCMMHVHTPSYQIGFRTGVYYYNFKLESSFIANLAYQTYHLANNILPLLQAFVNNEVSFNQTIKRICDLWK